MHVMVRLFQIYVFPTTIPCIGQVKEADDRTQILLGNQIEQLEDALHVYQSILSTSTNDPCNG
eukprot:m.742101 g.742101  ORF g.742101 m.742101 type:complete len:63 (+) comp23117_c0_seq8:167-355(+)